MALILSLLPLPLSVFSFFSSLSSLFKDRPASTNRHKRTQTLAKKWKGDKRSIKDTIGDRKSPNKPNIRR